MPKGQYARKPKADAKPKRKYTRRAPQVSTPTEAREVAAEAVSVAVAEPFKDASAHALYQRISDLESIVALVALFAPKYKWTPPGSAVMNVGGVKLTVADLRRAEALINQGRISDATDS